MPDIVDAAKRKEMMAGIRNKNTRPEMIIRQNLFSRGFRYRLHPAKIPGKPDIILPKYRALLFINGCFWHAHDCHLFKWPQSRKEFWQEKILSNKVRDEKNYAELRQTDWRILVIWECALKGKTRLDIQDLMSEVERWLVQGEAYACIQGGALFL